MDTALLSLAIDIVVLICLGTTIYFALRLSRALNAFRMHRSEFQKVIQDLNVNIEKAQSSISGLKEASRRTGLELQEQIDEAHGMTEELQLMTEAGNNLAGRLEKLAERNRLIAQGLDVPGPDPQSAPAPEPNNFEQPADSPPQKPSEEDAAPSFMIRDPEFEAGGVPPEPANEPQDKNLQSQAERELYEVLRKKKKG